MTAIHRRRRVLDYQFVRNDDDCKSLFVSFSKRDSEPGQHSQLPEAPDRSLITAFARRAPSRTCIGPAVAHGGYDNWQRWRADWANLSPNDRPLCEPVR